MTLEVSSACSWIFNISWWWNAVLLVPIVVASPSSVLIQPICTGVSSYLTNLLTSCCASERYMLGIHGLLVETFRDLHSKVMNTPNKHLWL